MTIKPAPVEKNRNIPHQQAFYDAAKEIRRTGISFRKAAEKYNINYVTLRRFCGRLTNAVNGVAGNYAVFFH